MSRTSSLYNVNSIILEIKKLETYSIPIYENGIKTEWTVDGVVGDDKYEQLIQITPEGKLPDMINVAINNNGK